MNNETARDLEFTKKLLIETSGLVADALKKPYETKWKLDNTPVTEIDLMVTEKVAAALKEHYPEDGIYGEEEAATEGASGFTWVLDPIDGTQALGMLPTSTICLARVGPDGMPVFSVVCNPSTGELFYSEEGQSYVNGEMMTVSRKDSMKGSYVYLGSRMPEIVASNGQVYDFLEAQGAKILNTRSLAYSCIMVAIGKAEGAYIGVSTPFEAASVKLLVENAGGKVTDLDGNEPKTFCGVINGLIVSNGVPAIHEQLMAAVKKS